MRVLQALFVALLLALTAGAQTAPSGRLILVLPFDNNSKTPGLDWTSESFPEVLGERMASDGFFVISRDDRLYAFDRLGLPATARPSRATVIRIARAMDVDYVVLGSYNYENEVFSASAEILDVKAVHLRPRVSGSSALAQLVAVQGSIAWDLLRDLDPSFSLSREAFVNAVPAVRLDAFENYLRGILAAKRTDRISYLKQAIKLNPEYPGALLQLGKTYFEGNEYEPAQTLLSRIPRSDPQAGEANFLLGLAYYYTANYPKAEEAFSFVNSRFPLTEVLNNLGVVSELRGHGPAALDYFKKASETDPSDADYRFNLALALEESGDSTAAQQHLKECLALQPSDAEAKLLFDSLASPRDPAAAKPALPEPRMKHNFDQATFLQAELALQQAMLDRLSKEDSEHQAAGLVEIGRRLLSLGLPLQAERYLREALALNSKSAAAHLAMAAVRRALNDNKGARGEASQAIALQPSADAYVLLAQIENDQNNVAAARDDLTHALQLEPTHAEALSLERSLNTKSTPGGRRLQ